MKMIYPNIYVDSIHDIALEELKKRRIKGFILDLDNTITLWNSNDISIQVEEWFKKIKSMGFKACILSNNGENGLLRWPNSWTFHIFIELPSLIRSFLRAMHLMGLQKEETAVIGISYYRYPGETGWVIYYFSGALDRREFFGTKISYDGKAGNA